VRDHPVLYEARPIGTSTVKLTEDILQLTELLARNTHEIWACRRLAEGWHYGPRRDDTRRVAQTSFCDVCDCDEARRVAGPAAPSPLLLGSHPI
jgi:hypothetical protein